MTSSLKRSFSFFRSWVPMVRLRWVAFSSPQVSAGARMRVGEPGFPSGNLSPMAAIDELGQPSVSTRVAGDVRWIVLDRPAKLNALTIADIREITRLVADPGPGTRGLVFTGAGTRAFCAGVHTATFVDLDPAGARAFIAELRDCL